MVLSTSQHFLDRFEESGGGGGAESMAIVPWQCSWRSSCELSGPFCLEIPYFHVWRPSNCSLVRANVGLNYRHSKSFMVPEIRNLVLTISGNL